jgi:hypothetical protein
MCLTLSWNTGFFIRAKADWLSTFNSTPSTSVFLRSPSSRLNHTPWHAATVAAMYSASLVERATTFYFCDCQLIRFPPRKYATPVVLLLVSISLAKSLSQYLIILFVLTTKVHGPCHIPDYPFYYSKVFFS